MWYLAILIPVPLFIEPSGIGLFAKDIIESGSHTTKVLPKESCTIHITGQPAPEIG